eukprot:TRINITY_DN15052_c0_g2_i10.p2 TRINITY_DN15052_c0_g2~~TRINITY_DN15052_c0_g2_i10.p2  ORF type:complete len:110 (+),score=12.48 TRINITY_DN15052_c0_g2_i10:642-971(+)
MGPHPSRCGDLILDQVCPVVPQRLSTNSPFSSSTSPHGFEVYGLWVKQGPPHTGPGPHGSAMGPQPDPWSRSMIRWVMGSHNQCRPKWFPTGGNWEFNFCNISLYDLII